MTESPPTHSIYPEQELTQKILKAAFEIHNALGAGFLERVYSNALSHELRQMGLACEQEVAHKVKYKDLIVGDYFADLVVERRVLVELKACTGFESIHEAQILNYLKASGIHVGLLLNFGKPKVEYRRFVF
jgi:GxxExxY protein